MRRHEFLQLSTIGGAATMPAPWARAADGRSAFGLPMYPQAQTADSRLDARDPDNFKSTTTARELAPA